MTGDRIAEASEGERAPTLEKKAGVFVTGSIPRHVIVMTVTGAVGLVAVFAVDFANLFYISQLGEQELAAAIGFASILNFFTISISIGVTIALGALVAKALGRGEDDLARRYATSGVLAALGVGILVVLGAWPFLGTFLGWLGAEGRTHEIALGYSRIVIPSFVFMTVGMACSGILRAVGDAKRAMYITLFGGLILLVLDPIFIFVLGLGVDGAAVASFLSRIAIAAIGLHGAGKVHGLLERPSPNHLPGDTLALGRIALPAILTNLATPVGGAYVTAAMAVYGDAAVAGFAITERIVPVAFGFFFAMSGAVGPIVGQNYGAGQFDRVRETLTRSLQIIGAYGLVVWLILFLVQDLVVAMFDATGLAAELIHLFCTWIAPTWMVLGALYVSNAAFNNLGYPFLSTAFNWGRATLGTIPFVWIGSQMGGAFGVAIGYALGSVLFGALAIVVAFRVSGRLSEVPEGAHPPAWAIALAPRGSATAATFGLASARGDEG